MPAHEAGDVPALEGRADGRQAAPLWAVPMFRNWVTCLERPEDWHAVHGESGGHGWVEGTHKVGCAGRPQVVHPVEREIQHSCIWKCECSTQRRT